MYRPLIIFSEEDRNAVLNKALEETNHPFTHIHKDRGEYAMVIKYTDGEDIVGVVWLYGLDDDDELGLHMAIYPKYQKRFFSRQVVSFLSMYCWAMGFTKVIVQDEYKEMAIKMGATPNEVGEAVFDLPFEWGTK